MIALRALGIGEPETFRCRIYGAESALDEERLAFLEALATFGVLECPAYDARIAALRERGWLPDEGELEPNPDGPGRVKRWRLTERGRAELARVKESR